MSKKRQRQIRLIFDLLLDVGAALFGLAGLAFVAYSYFTPELRDQPFDTSLEHILGHSGTLLFFVVFSLFMLLAGIFFARSTIRLMRNRAALENEEPPFADLR